MIRLDRHSLVLGTSALLCLGISGCSNGAPQFILNSFLLHWFLAQIGLFCDSSVTIMEFYLQCSQLDAFVNGALTIYTNYSSGLLKRIGESPST